MTTYCDSNRLKERILEAGPYPNGLYHHEMLLLSVAASGGATTEWMWREGELTYGCGVKRPQRLARSLVDRGYLRLSTDEETLDLLPMKYLRIILKGMGEKPGTSRAGAREKLMRVSDAHSVAKQVDFRFYVPTSQGERALETEMAESFSSMKNKNHDNDLEISAILDKEISENQASQYVAEFVKNHYTVTITDADDGGSYNDHVFDGPVTIIARFEDGSTLSVPNVYRVMPYANKRILFVETYTDNDIEHLFRMIDFNAKAMLPYERLGGKNELLNLHPPIPKGMPWAGVSGMYINPSYYDERELFFSPGDVIADIWLNRFLPEHGSLSEIRNPISGDSTKNYRLHLNPSEDDTFYYISYLIRRKTLSLPSLFQAPIQEVCRCLCRRSDDPFEAVAFDSLVISLDKIYGAGFAIRSLESAISPNPDEIWSTLAAELPIEMFYQDPYKGGPKPFREVLEQDQAYEKRFKNELLTLKEEGLIKAQWPSEFQLYLEIKALYPDTRYQYRADWLGQQSLDIFIPSYQVGIEYQGRQHYEPVEFFGGEGAFKGQRDRDERKAQLCKENGIKLICWPYSEAVNSRKVKRLLDEELRGRSKMSA